MSNPGADRAGAEPLPGSGRLLEFVGLLLVVLGVVATVAAITWGAVDAHDGTLATSDSNRLLPLGGSAVLVGCALLGAAFTIAEE